MSGEGDSQKGVRVADEGIYLKDDRYIEPKESHKKVVELIQQYRPEATSAFDAGCATGEFLYHLLSQQKNIARIAGVDVSDSMLEKAAQMVPSGAFQNQSLDSEVWELSDTYDVVTCLGVLSIFDDVSLVMSRLLSLVAPEGILVVKAQFNEDPIDVRLQYHRAESDDATWESGWNVTSCKSMERIIKDASVETAGVHWVDFRMPFSIPKKPADPMRSWTIETASDPHQQINGACQLVNQKFLVVEVGSK